METIVLSAALVVVAGIMAVQNVRDRDLIRRMMEKAHDLPPEPASKLGKSRVISRYKPKNNDGGNAQ